MRHVFLLVLALVASWHPLAAQTVLLWEYPRSLTPQSFLLTADGASGHLTWQTAPAAVGACLGTSSPDTYCTQLPTCPLSGSLAVTIVAVVAGEPSGPSAPSLPCTVLSPSPCRLTCGAVAPPGTIPGTIPTVGPSGDVFDVGNGQAIIDLPKEPLPDTLPPIDEEPPLPGFAPQAGQAPI
jgi:hypothetical protein